MEGWVLSGTDSEEEGGGVGEAAEVYFEFGGIKIPPSRLLDLMQTVQQKKTVELDSLSEISRKKRHKKKKKKNKAYRARSLEDVSETASEIRSTTSTSTTATESRDARRPNLQKFDPLFDDPELDDDGGGVTVFKSSLPSRIKKAPPAAQRKEKQLARLDKITADELRRRQRWQKTRQEQSEITQPLISRNHLNALKQDESGVAHVDNSIRLHTHVSPSVPNAKLRVSFEGEEEKEESMEVDVEGAKARGGDLMMFDDEDSDSDSENESDMKISLLSQINKVEQLLDSETLS